MISTPLITEYIGSDQPLHPTLLSEAERRENAEFIAGAYADSTRRVYRSQLRVFSHWCAERGVTLVAADSDLLITYFRERAEGVTISGRLWPSVGPTTLGVARAAISKAYQSAGLPDITKGPGLADALRAHRNVSARDGLRVRQASALTSGMMAVVRVTAIRPRTLPSGKLESVARARRRGLVDIALISLMRDCLLRRSEAAALRWGDLLREEDGSGRLYIGVSKTDQAGQGQFLFVSGRTMADLDAMRPGGSMPDDLVFGFNSRTISRRIKSATEAAGLIGDFSGHSPRVGMARDLARRGEDLPRLMTAGRWKSSGMVARYIAQESAGRGAVADFYRAG